MRLHRILILSNQPLFAQGVRSLVETNKHVKVVGIETYDDKTVGRLKALQPNIIVLGDESNFPSTVLPTLLDATPGVRIIRLTLDGNVIRVYDCHHVIAHQAKDLVDAFDFLFDLSKSTSKLSTPALTSVPKSSKTTGASPATQKKKESETDAPRKNQKEQPGQARESQQKGGDGTAL